MGLTHMAMVSSLEIIDNSAGLFIALRVVIQGKWLPPKGLFPCILD